MTRDRWEDRAACHDEPVSTFFRTAGEKHDNPRAAALCNQCLVRDACLDDELSTVWKTEQIHGYRAGMPAAERRILFTRRGRDQTGRADTARAYYLQTA